MNPDSSLDRFIQAQSKIYETALDELRAGRKRSHWMWFIFPQLRGLGHTSTSQYYGIANLSEARAYLDNPLLGPRLQTSCSVLLGLQSLTANAIFGSPDDIKLRSSMTLFDRASSGTDTVFARVLTRYFDGQSDPLTLTLLERTAQPD